MIQRKIVLATLGAWSVVFFLRPNSDLTLAINVLIVVFLIAGLVTQLVLMRKSYTSKQDGHRTDDHQQPRPVKGAGRPGAGLH